jgi:type III secretion protein Q
MADSTARKSKQPARAAATGVRGRIRALPPPQATALRDFFAAPQYWTLGDGGIVEFTPGTAPAGGETFAVDADGTRLLLRLDADAAMRPELHWSDYQGRPRLLAWSLAHEKPLMRLSEALGVSLLPLEAAQPGGDDDAVWLAFSIEDGTYDDDRPVSRLHGVVQVPAAWLARLLVRAAPVYEDDPLPSLGRWRTLPVPLALQFDGPRLDADDWRRMRPGDVVVVGRGRLPAVQARGARHAWPLEPVPAGWRVAAEPTLFSSATEHPSMNETDASPDADNDGQDSGPDKAEQFARNLPLQLSFEIGRVELSVGDLASLQPGYVFTLPANLEGANVTILANGRTAGHGEVVAVGETLGVRLLSWS